jgi:lipase chaperone LimK
MKFSLLSSLTLAFIAVSIGIILSVLNLSGVEFSTEVNSSTPTQKQTSLENKTLDDDNKTIDILELKTFRLASIDGSIKVDKHNVLIIDQDLRHWLDFYLSAIGEVNLQQIMAMMQQEINKLPNPGRDQAHEIMNQYLAYKKELGEYDNRELLAVDHHNDIEQLSNRLDWQMRLRRRHLADDVVESFWKNDEVIDNYALAKLTIKGSDLSDADKKEQLSALDKSLPESLYAFKQELYIASNLLEKEKALSQSDDPDELRNLRIQEVGVEATDRLEVIDKTQNTWRLKVVSYRDEQQRLSEIEGISATDKAAILSQYREDNFEEKERLRLPAAVQLLSDTL